MALRDDLALPPKPVKALVRRWCAARDSNPEPAEHEQGRRLSASIPESALSQVRRQMWMLVMPND